MFGKIKALDLALSLKDYIMSCYKELYQGNNFYFEDILCNKNCANKYVRMPLFLRPLICFFDFYFNVHLHITCWTFYVVMNRNNALSHVCQKHKIDD